MKNTVTLLLMALVLYSCAPGSAKKAKSIIEQEELVLQQAKKGVIDSIQVTNLLNEYELFAEKYPADTNTPDFLFKAADFYRYMHRPLKSIELYDRVYKNYPTHSKHAYSLLLEGFIYENEVGNYEAAKIKYNEFLKAFPNHGMAKDVRASLDNLGKTPEQLIEEFAALQKKDSLPQ